MKASLFILTMIWVAPLSTGFRPTTTRPNSALRLHVLKPLTQLDESFPKIATVKPRIDSELLRHADSRKKWGVDNSDPENYFFDKRIHTLGNIGFWGAVHAACAPMATKMIDDVAYGGIDIRSKVAQELSAYVGKSKARVLDMCCGVGFSTRALREAFPDAEAVIGLDTSKEMLSMADFLTKHLAFVKPIVHRVKQFFASVYRVAKEQGDKLQVAAQNGVCPQTCFELGNAEETNYPESSFDLVTVMYAFHEAPRAGRDKILREARRVLSPGGMLAVVDISTEYKPSVTMLAGEPYVLDYQKSIHDQLEKLEGFLHRGYKILVPGHVGMWLLERTALPALA